MLDSILTSCLWSPGQLHELLPQLALQSQITDHPEKIQPLSLYDTVCDTSVIDQWMELAAVSLRIEVIPTKWDYSETQEMLRCLGPSLIQLPGENPPRFLALLRGGKRHVTVLAPDLKKYSVPGKDIFNMLTAPLQEAAAEPATRILQRAGISEERIQIASGTY